MKGLNLTRLPLVMLISFMIIQHAEGALITELSVKNTQNIGRVEYANSAVAIAEGLSNRTQGFYITDQLGELIPAQFTVASRWGATQPDLSASIKFLEILLLASLDAEEEQLFQLHYEPDFSIATQNVLQDTDDTNRFLFETDELSIQINTASTGLIESFDFNDNLHSSTGLPFSGPYLVQSGQQINAVQSSVVIEENEQLRAVIKSRGVFPGSGLSCGGEDLSYTSRLTFHKDLEQVEFSFDLHNTNGDPQLNGVNTQFACSIEEAGWLLPVSVSGEQDVVKTSDGASVFNGRSGTISQNRGSTGNPDWRNATMTVNSSLVQEAAYFLQPSLGISRGTDAIVATIPWMRHREPQGIVADQSGLKILFAADSITLAEAQTRWGQAKIGFASVPDDAQFIQTAGQSLASQEHGLLVLAPPDYINTTKVLPRLPTDWQSAAQQLAQWQVSLVANTVGDGGQFERLKNFGMSWPDYSYNQPWSAFDAPGQFTTGTNYWSESSNIAAYTLATQQPEAFWQLAYPLEKTFLQSIVYYKLHQAQPNIFGKSGLIRAGNQAGDEATGGMFRSGYNSQDYLYNQGSALVGAILRPDNALIDVFATACQTMLTRYGPDTPQQLYVNQRRLSRYAVQHINMLRYSSQFVKDRSLANQCAALYHDIMQDLAEGPLAKGMFCSGTEAPETSCETDQGFMFFGLHQDLFVDYILDNQATRPQVVQRFKTAMQNYAREGLHNLVQLSDSGDVSVQGNIMRNTRLSCTFDETQLQGCTGIPYDVLQAESAGQLTSFIIADFMSKDLSQQICERSRAALLPAIRSGASYMGLGAWKGAAQFRRNLIFGAGITENCSAIESQAINANMLPEPYPQAPVVTEPGTTPGGNNPPTTPVETGNPPAESGQAQLTIALQLSSLDALSATSHNLQQDDLVMLENQDYGAQFSDDSVISIPISAALSLQQGAISMDLQTDWTTDIYRSDTKVLFSLGAMDNIPAIRLVRRDRQLQLMLVDSNWNTYIVQTIPGERYWQPGEIVPIEARWDGTGNAEYQMQLTVNGETFETQFDFDIGLFGSDLTLPELTLGNSPAGNASVAGILSNIQIAIGYLPDATPVTTDPESANPEDFQYIDFALLSANSQLTHNLQDEDLSVLANGMTAARFATTQFLNQSLTSGISLQQGQVSFYLQADWITQNWSPSRRTLFNIGAADNIPAIRLTHADGRFVFVIADQQWHQYRLVTPQIAFWEPNEIVHIQVAWDGTGSSPFNMLLSINGQVFTHNIENSIALLSDHFNPASISFGSLGNGQNSADAMLANVQYRFGQPPETDNLVTENNDPAADVQIDFDDLDALLSFDTNLDATDVSATSDNDTGLHFSEGQYLSIPAQADWDLAQGEINIRLEPKWLSQQWSANRRTLFNMGSPHNVPSLKLEHADSRIRFTIADNNWQRQVVYSSNAPLWQVGEVVNIALRWDLNVEGQRMIEMDVNGHRFVNESVTPVALSGSDLGHPYLNIGSNPGGQRSVSAVLIGFEATFGQ